MSSEQPALHLPEEPTALRRQWLDLVYSGRSWDDLIESEGGPATWLWSRWKVLRGAGLEEKDFIGLVVAYRRELWLWLLGERTWRQACSGLIGRINRRIAQQSRGRDPKDGSAKVEPVAAR